MLTLRNQIHETLTKQQATLSLVETCTSGAVGAFLTETPGASRWFLGSHVAYSNHLKSYWFDVDELIMQHGAVSEPVALAMASGAKQQSQATHTLAITGIQGPDGGTPTKPVGMICMAYHGIHTATTTVFCHGDRIHIRQQTIQHALNFLWRSIHE